jgi:hypothetical protein
MILQNRLVYSQRVRAMILTGLDHFQVSADVPSPSTRSRWQEPVRYSSSRILYLRTCEDRCQKPSSSWGSHWQGYRDRATVRGRAYRAQGRQKGHAESCRTRVSPCYSQEQCNHRRWGKPWSSCKEPNQRIFSKTSAASHDVKINHKPLSREA